jgi:23S rRNA (cytidine1920-2'-O)/16S rRNA (cytidine1409-2'-O)-methyltransferase
MAVSRTQAATLIADGAVRVVGIPTPKASSLVEAGDPIELVGPAPRFVGRGGEKLDAAMEAFALSVQGKNCLDAGASTGGFTDCLLQRGAGRVVALDVGYGQLDDRLAGRSEVVVVDRTNLRHVTAEDLGGPFDLVVADLSFISLCTVAEVIWELTKETGDVVVLVKPQFEVGRGEVGRGGVVKDPELHRSAVDRVTSCFETVGLIRQGIIASPITGAKGNREFLLWARPGVGEVPVMEMPI